MNEYIRFIDEIERYLPSTVSVLELFIFMLGAIMIVMRIEHLKMRIRARDHTQEQEESSVPKLVATWLVVSDGFRIIIKEFLLGLIVLAMTRENNSAFDPYTVGGWGNSVIYCCIFIGLHLWGRAEDYYTRVTMTAARMERRRALEAERRQAHWDGADRREHPTDTL